MCIIKYTTLMKYILHKIVLHHHIFSIDIMLNQVISNRYHVKTRISFVSYFSVAFVSVNT